MTLYTKRNGIYLPQPNIHPKTKDPALEKTLGTYVEYSEIFSGTDFEDNSKDILISEIRKFDFYDLLQALAKLNYFLAPGHRKVDRTELLYLNEFFPTWSIEHQRLALQFSKKRKLFFRQQILAMMKFNVLKNDMRKNKKLVKEDLTTFGRMLIRVTGFIEGNTNVLLKKARSKEETKKILFGSIVRNIFFYSKQQFRYTLIRYWHLFKNIAPKIEENKYDIVGSFKKYLGVDIDHYIMFAFSIWAHYLNVRNEISDDPRKFLIGENYFSNLSSLMQEKAENICKNLSASKEQFKRDVISQDKEDDLFSYDCFQRRPLYRLPNGNYFVLDQEYLESRLTFGVYHALNDVLLKKAKTGRISTKKKYINERNRLNAFVGRCLEKYAHDLLCRIYGRRSKRFLSEISGDKTGGVDFLVIYPNTIFFIEVTTKGLRQSTVMTGDENKINKEIKDILFGASHQESKGKIIQLLGAIEGAKKGKLGLGFKIKKTTKIVPVIVTQTHIPTMPGLLSRYRTMIENEGYGSEIWNNLQFWDIEELEMLESIVCNGNSLENILEINQKSIYRNYPFKNFLYYEESIKLGDNKYLQRKRADFFRSIQKDMFPKKKKIDK